MDVTPSSVNPVTSTWPSSWQAAAKSRNDSRKNRMTGREWGMAGRTIANSALAAALSGLFAGDVRLAGRDRQHDAESEGDDQTDADPDRRNRVEHSGVPERQYGAHDQQEVPDQIDVDELHESLL